MSDLKEKVKEYSIGLEALDSIKAQLNAIAEVAAKENGLNKVLFVKIAKSYHDGTIDDSIADCELLKGWLAEVK